MVGIGEGRCPFHSLIFVPVIFNGSDRTRDRLPIVLADGKPLPKPINIISEEVRMKAVACSHLGDRNGRNGRRSFGSCL